MSEFQGFVRKQFPVQAARVTPLNIHELAEACGGKIMHDGDKDLQFSRDYIKVRVAYPLNEEQTKARIGDWLVKQNRNFKVYKDKAFRNTFESVDGSPVPNHPIQQEQNPVPSPANMPKKLAEAGVLTEEAQAVVSPIEEEIPNDQENSPEAVATEEPVTEETEALEEFADKLETEQADDSAAMESQEKQSITLDELNTMPGDPRSTQEIMAEGH